MATLELIGMERTYEATISFTWLAAHATHRLRLRNEYGEVDGQCCRRVVCSHCGCEPGYCDLDADHPGTCSTAKVRALAKPGGPS